MSATRKAFRKQTLQRPSLTPRSKKWKSPFEATYTHRVQSNPFTSCEIASLLSEEVTELQAVASDFDERLWVSAAQVRLTEVLPARKKC